MNISEDTLSGRMINQLLILEHFEKVVKLAFYNALFTFEFWVTSIQPFIKQFKVQQHEVLNGDEEKQIEVINVSIIIIFIYLFFYEWQNFV